MQYNLAGIYQRLGLMYSLHLIAYSKYGGSMFHKTLTSIYQHTYSHIPEESNFQGEHTFLSAVRCRKLQKLCTFLSLLQYQFSELHSKTVRRASVIPYSNFHPEVHFKTREYKYGVISSTCYL